MVEWSRWHWSLILTTNWLPSVLLRFYTVSRIIWPVKIVHKITYNVLSGMLSLFWLTRTTAITAWQCCVDIVHRSMYFDEDGDLAREFHAVLCWCRAQVNVLWRGRSLGSRVPCSVVLMSCTGQCTLMRMVTWLMSSMSKFTRRQELWWYANLWNDCGRRSVV